MILLILSGILITCNSASKTDKIVTSDPPIDVVIKYLNAEKNNDAQEMFSTLSDGHELKDIKLATKSLNIVEVKNENNPRYMEKTLKGEIAKQNGWTKENISFVSAIYDVQYDNSLVPYESGHQEDVFMLVRKDKNSPWLIHDSGLT